ncbi:transcription factor HES-5-like [Rhinophrynus dorsalis]
MADNGVTMLISRQYSEDKLTTKEKNKLRKPMVEKKRRDRINSSIGQLRILLEREFQLLQPDSKPEKADILEIAVQFLKQQICSHSNDKNSFKRKDYQQYRQGYDNCLRETLSFLSVQHVEEEMRVQLLNHFHQSESHPRITSIAAAQQKKQGLITSTKPLWRPW